MKKSHIAILTTLAIILIDQASKIWVKTHMHLGEEIPVFGDWGKIHFTENPGMAFGWSWGGAIGKYALSTFRIIFSGVIIYYIKGLIKQNVSTGFLIAVCMILAGAVGNVVDCAFYGLIFSESGDFMHTSLAEFVSFGTGYAPFLQGRVVDMLFFPMFQGNFPMWFPIWGGEDFLFFPHIFNVADSAITVGVTIILLFYRSFFEEKK